ncbi:MAG: nuclear transport factor 2 family protein [Rhizorhabdus sp.]|jgi:ketosteroid isomerase-like protein|nr:MAG: nuclear transport factor 2 family protein [Rhizorhabdus sp.]
MTPAPDLAIRMRRAAFNRALADADLAAIGPILAPNAILVAGTDSAVIAGRKAQLQAWKREFAAPGRTIYTRTPERIEVSEIAPIALEHGRWQGVSVDGAPLASGSYTAKWRLMGADWVIEAELYLTLA